ncbi:MAG: hypothetical protein ACREYE_30290 [Gammaproteobacteria bacterium]
MNEQLIPVCMRAGPSPTAPPGALAIVVRVPAGAQRVWNFIAARAFATSYLHTRDRQTTGFFATLGVEFG